MADAPRLRPGIADRRTLRGLLAHRELAIALTVRELTVRYKRSLLGLGWAIAEPLFVVAVYVAVFGFVLRAGEGLTNYPLFTLMGLLPWLFLSATLEQSATVLMEHAPLIRKVYFPREILVGTVVVSRLSTLLVCISLAFLIALSLAATGAPIAWARAPLVLVGIALVTCGAFGLSLALAAMNVVLRDTSFLVRFALRIGFYACPIVYPLALVPAAARPIYDVNPLVGILWFFQAMSDAALAPPSDTAIASALLGPLIALVLGFFVFRRLEPAVADLL
jgi:ABC-type polysaccharide/polyol phosphate export permease